jgi:hypothetical protein
MKGIRERKKGMWNKDARKTIPVEIQRLHFWCYTESNFYIGQVTIQCPLYLSNSPMDSAKWKDVRVRFLIGAIFREARGVLLYTSTTGLLPSSAHERP